MSALEVALRRIVSLLDEAGATCARIGGLAVSVHLEPRFTRDVDLAVAAATDAHAEALVQSSRAPSVSRCSMASRFPWRRLRT